MNSSRVRRQAPGRNGALTCILVVEDELLIRLMLSDGLRDQSYHVIEAGNADEALLALEVAITDLIISYVRRPRSLDGMGLLAVVRETLPDLPVVITSGHLQSNLALADGATQFIGKPYAMELLIDAIRTALAQSQWLLGRQRNLPR